MVYAAIKYISSLLLCDEIMDGFFINGRHQLVTEFDFFLNRLMS